jgi:hypothetical protein
VLEHVEILELVNRPAVPSLRLRERHPIEFSWFGIYRKVINPPWWQRANESGFPSAASRNFRLSKGRGVILRAVYHSRGRDAVHDCRFWGRAHTSGGSQPRHGDRSWIPKFGKSVTSRRGRRGFRADDDTREARRSETFLKFS